jgi:hypothetical protein
LGQHPAKMQSHRADLLQPVPLQCRNLVERFFNKIKQCRRVATRYDKLAANYRAFIQLASIRLWLRVSPRPLHLLHDANREATSWGLASLMRPAGSLSAYRSCACRYDAAQTYAATVVAAAAL